MTTADVMIVIAMQMFTGDQNGVSSERSEGVVCGTIGVGVGSGVVIGVGVGVGDVVS